jgi:hypothetical protein
MTFIDPNKHFDHFRSFGFIWGHSARQKNCPNESRQPQVQIFSAQMKNFTGYFGKSNSTPETNLTYVLDYKLVYKLFLLCVSLLVTSYLLVYKLFLLCVSFPKLWT